jgi:hypothetical protein
MTTIIILPPEVNRLLGNALLNGAFQKQVLGTDRVAALGEYTLSAAERQVVMSSTAVSLPGLAGECCAALGRQDPNGAYADAQTLASNYGIEQVPIAAIRGTLARLIGATAPRSSTLPDQQALSGMPAALLAA